MQDLQSEGAPRWREAGSSRLGAFVDAAFAFAVTLLVIAVDRLPDSTEALLQALKNVPAFAASFALLAMFWYAHVRWSRRYRLDTVPAVLLSLLLVFLVLIYVYPLRLLMGTFFGWMTGGWLPMPAGFASQHGVLFVFQAYAIAFASMSACVLGLYLHAWRQRRALRLEDEAAAATYGEVASWAYFVLIGLVSALLAAVLPVRASPWLLALPGCVYFLLSFTALIEGAGQRRARRILHADRGATA